MKHTPLLAALLVTFAAPVLAATLCPDGKYHADGAWAHANCALTARTPLHHAVLWRRTGNTFRTMVADRNLRRMGGISLIPVPWCCAQMAITTQVEAVDYFRMVDTLALNNQHSS